MNNQWQIRLLGGALHGREIKLPDTGLTLGERGCDVCLPLIGTARVALRIDAGKLYVDADGAAARVNGRRHRQGVALPATGILQTAGLTLAFGSPQDCLAEMTLPVRYGAFLWTGAIAVVLLATLLAGLWLSGAARDSGPGIPGWVEMLLQQPGMDKVKAVWAADGVLTLSGYCAEGAQMGAARLRLASWGVVFRDRVVRGDLLARDVQDLLLQAGYTGARVRSTAPGEVCIQGDITMGKRWTAVLPQLRLIPGLRRWHIENRHAVQSRAIISALRDNGLLAEISVTPVGDAFTLSGVLDAPGKARVIRLLDRLRTQFPGLALSYQAVPASADGAQRLPSPAAGIIHSRHGDYLMLENGVRLQVGSQLPDGGEVIALTDRAISIHYRGTLINYPFDF
ncbi:hypothetical protein SGGMMB4_02894 [Sodalis glossinidius str. 'morsitans']|uniref:Uncharacterized protein n=1 Tax=Sodalis glossinidius (strain morsitans) TaxID=343509 RepID=A0A193QJB5_SODGM|nr:type III secretion system inner membrane ring subunit SctD [Sodalis glossinidius]CRL45279.1 hypothetical protein SGGMMB4_02894 [Sodalis glossinidius str. 'morsitans']